MANQLKPDAHLVVNLQARYPLVHTFDALTGRALFRCTGFMVAVRVGIGEASRLEADLTGFLEAPPYHKLAAAQTPRMQFEPLLKFHLEFHRRSSISLRVTRIGRRFAPVAIRSPALFGPVNDIPG